MRIDRWAAGANHTPVEHVCYLGTRTIPAGNAGGNPGSGLVVVRADTSPSARSEIPKRERNRLPDAVTNLRIFSFCEVQKAVAECTLHPTSLQPRKFTDFLCLTYTVHPTRNTHFT